MGCHRCQIATTALHNIMDYQRRVTKHPRHTTVYSLAEKAFYDIRSSLPKRSELERDEILEIAITALTYYTGAVRLRAKLDGEGLVELDDGRIALEAIEKLKCYRG